MRQFKHIFKKKQRYNFLVEDVEINIINVASLKPMVPRTIPHHIVLSYRIVLHIGVFGFGKVFDQVLHNLIWYAVHGHGVPELIMKLLYKKTTSCAVGLFDSFPISVDAAQGSCCHFYLFLFWILLLVFHIIMFHRHYSMTMISCW